MSCFVLVTVFEGCVLCTVIISLRNYELFNSKSSTFIFYSITASPLLFFETYTVTLNTGEAALAVAVGEGWSAVATSLGLLRLFSSTGIPIALVTLKGPIVTMVGYVHQLAGKRKYVCTYGFTCFVFVFIKLVLHFKTIFYLFLIYLYLLVSI